MRWFRSLVRFLSDAFDGVAKAWSKDEPESEPKPPTPPVTPPW